VKNDNLLEPVERFGVLLRHRSSTFLVLVVSHIEGDPTGRDRCAMRKKLSGRCVSDEVPQTDTPR
jgi:hypothetical protein